ncbi:MAG TPA: hypothetical protein VNJ03_14990 [Vicinamibacterales bacterium]|nr:hypothetical protein [Vicinamibacterales bacterium]
MSKEKPIRAMSEIGPTTYTNGDVIFPTDKAAAPVDAVDPPTLVADAAVEADPVVKKSAKKSKAKK